MRPVGRLTRELKCALGFRRVYDTLSLFERVRQVKFWLLQNSVRHTDLTVYIHVGSQGVSLSEPFSTRASRSENAISMSLLSAAAFVAVPSLSFTWPMNFPVPCNKRAGSGRHSKTVNTSGIEGFIAGQTASAERVNQR